jgi:hypothetical protein
VRVKIIRQLQKTQVLGRLFKIPPFGTSGYAGIPERSPPFFPVIVFFEIIYLYDLGILKRKK